MNTKCRLAIEKYKMLAKGDHIVLGLSGGADSCAMLHFLCSMRDEFELKITAVHVNHLIRGEEAERDARFAESFCRSLNVDFVLYQRDIPALAKSRGQGLEECGRAVRYEIFAQEASKYEGKIATAHTQSDSIETVLFHIIRGCSINGLKGIPPTRGNIIRPLILCERSDIETYCSAHNIEYITDSTNLSSDYSRNKIRLQILPIMKEINPSISDAIARLSECAAEDDNYLQKDAQSIADEYLSMCKIDKLYTSDRATARRALALICHEKLGIIPEYKHITAMLECLEQGFGRVNLTNDNVVDFADNKLTFFHKNDLIKKKMPNSIWSSNIFAEKIITPFGQKLCVDIISKEKYENISKNQKNVFKNSIDYDKIKDTAVFRFRYAGDIFSQAGRKNTKSLKKLFNENKIPADQRNKIPLLECDGKIAWICGTGPAEGFQVTKSTQKVVYIKGV